MNDIECSVLKSLSERTEKVGEKVEEEHRLSFEAQIGKGQGSLQ